MNFKTTMAGSSTGSFGSIETPTPDDILILANALLLQTRGDSSKPPPAISIKLNDVKDVNKASFYRLLFWGICGPIVEEKPLLPPDSDMYNLVKIILEFISCHLLNLDMSNYVAVEDICSGSLSAVYGFLKLFENLQQCLQPLDLSEIRRPAISSRIVGSKSVLYSPRTKIRRKMMTSVPIKLSQKKKVRGPQVEPNLYLMSLENLCSRVRLKKKIASSFSVDHSTVKTTTMKQDQSAYFQKTATDRRHEVLALKRAKLVLENCKKRNRSETVRKIRARETVARKCISLQMESEALEEKRKEQLHLRYAQLYKDAENRIQDELRSSLIRPKNVIEKIAALERKC